MSAHTIEELSPTKRKFKITVPADDVRKSWDKIVKEMQESAQVRGFRKGKAPLSLIKTVYAHDITKKVINTLVNDSYQSAVKESKLQVLNQPTVEPESKLSENSEFSYSAVVDIYTEVNIQDYKGLAVTLPESLNESAEKAEFEKLLKHKSEHVHDENCDHSHEEHVHGENCDHSHEEHIHSENCDHSHEEHSQNDLKASDAKTPAELPKDLEAKFQEQVKSYFKSLRSEQAYNQVIDQILEKNQFDVAEPLVEQMLDQVIYTKEVVIGKKDPKTLQVNDKTLRSQYRADAERQVKAVVALTQIAKQENITVSQEELMGAISNYLMKNNLNFQQIRDNQQTIVQEHKSDLTLRKVMNHLLEHAQITWTADQKEDQVKNEEK